ncbi:MAG: hypothetical protein IJ851_00870 [Eubacterium sp.]|nr:hypothetical protein [Eubacterium sp.]
MIINKLVETHCHILPGIDDGSPDVETSVKMIKRLQAQGCETIILTPHYYSDSISYDDFITMRDESLASLKAALGYDAPKLIPAAEVYITPYLFNYDNLEKLVIGKSRYALIEHPFSCSFGENTYDRLLNLNYDYNIKPILAHIERYPALMENPSLIDDYIDMGCLVQVNISSFVDSRKSVKKKLFKYLETGRIHLIGSDSHNLTTRPPEYAQGVKEIVDRYGQEALDVLESNARLLAE